MQVGVGRKVVGSSSSSYSNSSIIVEVIVDSIISGALTKTQSSWRFWVLYKLPQKIQCIISKNIIYIYNNFPIRFMQFFFNLFFVHQDDRES